VHEGLGRAIVLRPRVWLCYLKGINLTLPARFGGSVGRKAFLQLGAESRGVCWIAGFVSRLLAAANNGERQKR
jgi:hypothetical protein